MRVILVVLLYLQVCLSQRPELEGVGLFQRQQLVNPPPQFSPLSNVSIVSASDLDSSRGIACGSALVTNDDIGEWFFPDGSNVRTNNGDPVNFLPRISYAELHRRQRGFPSSLEGIYKCRIPDENLVMRTLFVGVYADESYQGDASPQLSTPIALATPSASPDDIIFTLTCTSTGFPPTTVEWTRNSGPLPEMSSSYQELRDGRSSTFDNVLEVQGALAGTYRCTVTNTRGSSAMETIIRVPSGSPRNLRVSELGGNRVRVTWTPPTDVSRYEVMYWPVGSDATSIAIDNATATDATLEDLMADVEYSIVVQAFAELPGPRSAPAMVTLDAPPPPSDVTVTSPTPTSLLVQWDRVNDALGYKVTFTPEDRSCDGVEGGNVLVMGGANVSHTLQKLEEFTEYRVDVRSQAIVGVGVSSDPVSKRTRVAGPAPPNITSAVGRRKPPGFTVAWQPLECRDINAESIVEFIVRYGRVGGDGRELVVARTSPFTFPDESLVDFVDYEIELAAVNSDFGVGTYSAPVTAVILDDPGPVNSLRISPDIVSIGVTWEPPSRGGKFVTQYEITHQLTLPVEVNPIGQVRLSNSTFSFRVSDLLPNFSYEIIVSALIGELQGEMVKSVQSTLTIGGVFGVMVSPLDDTSVQVTWVPLASRDLAEYKVYFTRIGGDINSLERRQEGEEREGVVRAPANATSTRVEGLENGAEYQFQVVGVVIVNGLERDGERSNGSTAVVGEVTGSSEDLTPAVIVGIVIAVVVFIIIVLLFIICFLLLWRRSTSGRYVVKKTKGEANYELKHKSPSTLPMDFEPFVPTSKPAITHQPPDITALEGQRVAIQPKVTGSPTPTIAWYHEGSMVLSDYACDVGEDGTLVFACVELKHAGLYRFTVSNSAGSIQGQVKLKVYSEEDSRNSNLLNPDDSLLTKKISVQAFGDYVEELHAHGNTGFREQFYRLPNREGEHTVNSAQRPAHKNLNRFTNITVYDGNRVVLKPLGNIPTCQHDYINACYINGYFMSKKFVVTQGPTQNTTIDFWRMVWQLRTPTIVMITNLMEAGREKCVQYWPEADTADYGPFRVFLSAESVYGNYTIRTFHLNFTQKTQNPLKVIQYHFTTWPDHGIPDYVAPMLAFHRKIKTEHKSMLGPMMVHCSAGVGRSGTFITLDIALQQASGEDCVDVPAIISNLRNQRMKMVQTQEQYVFIHDAVLESLVCGNTQIPVHDLKRSIELLLRWDPNSGMSGFQSLFQVLEQMSPKADEEASTSARDNMDKNRYITYLPSDKHRVVLKTEYPDYIHATFVDGYKEKKKFIIAQSPLENTIRDFWKMVYERNCASIVMLCGMVEDEEDVCCKYWPTRGIEQYGEYDVSLLEQTMHDGFLERTYSVTDSKSGQAHRVTQFQVINWDPHGIVFNIMAVLNIIHRVNSLQKNGANGPSGPIVVHCSDTVTRSAIFCSVTNAIECCKVERTVDIFQAVKVLRSQRPGAIPTVEQYQIIHDILLYHVQNVPDY